MRKLISEATFPIVAVVVMALVTAIDATTAKEAITVGAVGAAVVIVIVMYQAVEGVNLTSLFQSINDGFQTETINERDDLIIILDDFNDKKSTNLTLEYVLEKYIIFSRKNDDKFSPERNDLIKNYIKKEKEITPYSNLPEYERTLFADLEKSLNTPSESLLNKLAEAIMTRERSNDKLMRTSKWSTIFGFVGTTLSIIMFILWFAKPSVTQEGLNEVLNKTMEKYSITKDTIN